MLHLVPAHRTSETIMIINNYYYFTVNNSREKKNHTNLYNIITMIGKKNTENTAIENKSKSILN